ncbi:grasp-with-spasm system SPASM domain peptide maturase [Novosphingopyxis iocasae]|uniref:grasp-with-spasm system SPASM domain peptide maturase n=1 Tax=Novosphingopyxis iocasae TaxID=2762729 RepID=UPI0016513D9A|nr:grasp-with-spasm system SPASM domain peptide maturase [Novosphingopyxis iocasae]
MREKVLGAAEEADKRFYLFPTCRLVHGSAFSAIYDFDRYRLLRFDSAYAPLIALAARPSGLSMKDVDGLGHVAKKNAQAILLFLERNEVGQILKPEIANAFRPPETDWSAPHGILNSVVDVNEQDHPWQSIIDQLDEVHCPAIQIRGFGPLLNSQKTRELLHIIDGTSIRHVQLLAVWSEEWSDDSTRALFEQFTNLVSLVLHGAPKDRLLEMSQVSAFGGKLYRWQERKLNGASDCGAITEGSLCAPSANLFAELNHFNGCLNRKLSIRSDGSICNCPSMKKSFGKDVNRINNIVRTSEFTRVWDLAKDKIDVCRDCEFRYVCTDCRAYLESDDSTSKPLKCTYDPYSGSWSD